VPPISRFEGGEYVRAFLCELEKIGYKSGATVECGMKDPADEIPKAAAFLGLVPKSYKVRKDLIING
jgi:hypothetical protein